MTHHNELFHTLFSCLKDPAWVKDLDGRYVLVNQAFADFFEMEIAELQGKTAFEIFPFTSAKVVEESDLKAGQTRELVCNDEKVPDFEGEQIVFHTRKQVVLTDKGKLVYIVGVASNMSRLRNLEKENKLLRAKQDDNDAALRTLLDLRERDKKTLENRTTDMLEESVLPYLNKLAQGHLDSVQSLLLETVLENIHSLTSSQSSGMAAIFLKLTPMEMQIAELIRKGLSGKEIGARLNLSTATVNTHRRNMRKRLGLNGKKINLRQYLLAH